jgi:hypothetical protein
MERKFIQLFSYLVSKYSINRVTIFTCSTAGIGLNVGRERVTGMLLISVEPFSGDVEAEFLRM